MKSKRVVQILVFVILVTVLAAGVALADDGQMMIRNVSKSPHTETVDAAFGMMDFYVPAQASNGAAVTIDYVSADGTITDTSDIAVPLFTFYLDGIEEEEEHVEDVRVEGSEIQGGASFGARDAYVGVSLDDGTTWKRMNVSNSAHSTSFTLDSGVEFPGDVYAGDFAVAGDKVFAAWLSRYCLGGTAAYTILEDDGDPETDDYVYPDYFGVMGTQGSVDYALQGFPEVGQVPYGCVWTARGQLVAGDDEATTDVVETYHMVWTKPERLTSGRRDANRLEVAGVEGAGFAIVWQEDPKGLRPGTGLGPGEGWSGAIVGAKTDIWYSYIGYEGFDVVCYDPNPDDDTYVCDPEVTETLATFTGDTAAKVAVPMTVPVRVTDNNKCSDRDTAVDHFEYCELDFSGYPEEAPILPADPTSATFCSDTITWTPPDPYAETQLVCVTEDGRVLLGRVGASRPRIGMHGYDSDYDGIVDSAWVILGYEETKALGEGTADVDAAADSTETVPVIDIGKNLWYHSFDIAHPDIVSHGNILNQPAMDPLTNVFFETLNTDEDTSMDFGEYAYDFYETEIARRFSLISQDWNAAGPSGMVAFTLVKQGIIKQGGPADIYGQRFVLPDTFNPAADNPYAFENMVCENWDFHPEADTSLGRSIEYNPYYPKGICLDTPTNLSGTKAVACDGGDCPALETVYVCEDDVCDFELALYDRVIEWSQCGPDYGGAFTACNVEDSTLDDQSWENPFDIAKGHRGFADGDFIQVLYAWSPNYKENAVGHDHYNLYVRRSFDGGLTWTTLPASFAHTDGVTYSGDGTSFDENYGWGSGNVYPVTFDLSAGEFEPARNVSQLIGSRETILDPRYSPTADSITKIAENGEIVDTGVPINDHAVRDPSKFFIVYETGDNTTVITGEATPLDLYYSRAVDFGDDYDVIEYAVIGDNGELTVEERWDALEKGAPESGEASIAGNPAGTFFYAAWNQALEIGDEEFTDMDAYFRRVMYVDEDTASGEDVDYAPIASIIYISEDWLTLDETEEGDMLVLIGTARDGDHIGDLPADDIAEVQWYLDDVEVDDGDDDHFRLNYQAGCDEYGNCTFNGMHPGWNNFTFKAKDKGGRWSPGASVNIFITQHTYRTYVPVLLPSPFD